MHEATTIHVPWGLWVAGYIFFLGLSAGSFLLSTLIYVFGVRRLEAVGPLALLQALGCLVLGGMLIVLDLGHPERIHKVLVHPNPTSAMAWMGIFYNLYILIVLIELYLVLRPRFVEKIRAGEGHVGLYRILTLGRMSVSVSSLARDSRWLKILGIIGIPVAITVHGGVGMIFAVAKARPTWYGGLFPIVFLISALASGGALLTFLVAAFNQMQAAAKRELVQSLARLTIGILAFDLLITLSEILTKLYGDIPHEVIAWRETLFGPYWYVFWVVQILIGAAVPIAIVSLPRTRARVGWLGLAGSLIVFGIAGTRLNLVIPGQIQPLFEELAGAYNHPRFALGYFPSPNEWLVAIGVLSIGIWLFIVSMRYLPILDGGVRDNAEQGGS